MLTFQMTLRMKTIFKNFNKLQIIHIEKYHRIKNINYSNDKIKNLLVFYICTTVMDQILIFKSLNVFINNHTSVKYHQPEKYL